ncbi:unnamed protein product [Protopolystoma xenopodis]|uniref:Uncharacterized protein n=1 Tax=Protopolystoma xenopodis TaxID=117903 RepID=A0A448WMK5_9PLAT|nr:unnamed protein product [Protopolystoma xenopodis]
MEHWRTANYEKEEEDAENEGQREFNPRQNDEVKTHENEIAHLREHIGLDAVTMRKEDGPRDRSTVASNWPVSLQRLKPINPSPDCPVAGTRSPASLGRITLAEEIRQAWVYLLRPRLKAPVWQTASDSPATGCFDFKPSRRQEQQQPLSSPYSSLVRRHGQLLDKSSVRLSAGSRRSAGRTGSSTEHAALDVIRRLEWSCIAVELAAALALTSQEAAIALLPRIAAHLEALPDEVDTITF